MKFNFESTAKDFILKTGPVPVPRLFAKKLTHQQTGKQCVAMRCGVMEVGHRHDGGDVNIPID